MIYPIVKFGDPVLDKPSAPVTVFDADLRKLVDDMFESMYAAHGVGLAAPQIGIAKRIAVIDVTFKEDPDAKIVLVNPEIVHTEGKLSASEGCLSLPEFREKGDPAAQGDGARPGPDGQDHRSDRRRVAGPGPGARNRSPERQTLPATYQRAEARPDQAQNSQADEARGVVRRSN
jgi:hypothetical protein